MVRILMTRVLPGQRFPAKNNFRAGPDAHDPGITRSTLSRQNFSSFDPQSPRVL